MESPNNSTCVECNRCPGKKNYSMFNIRSIKYVLYFSFIRIKNELILLHEFKSLLSISSVWASSASEMMQC